MSENATATPVQDIIDSRIKQMGREGARLRVDVPNALGDWDSSHCSAEMMFSYISRLRSENERLREALKQIACFDDLYANRRLERFGEYGSFDEPGSVQIARAALSPNEPEPLQPGQAP